MLHEEPFITSLFKILNVLVLGGVAAYFFKTRVLIHIKEAIAQKKAQAQALRDEKIALKERLHKIENEIIEQQEACARILEKVESWKDTVKGKQELLYQEAEARAEERAARIKKQSVYLHQLKVRQQVLPAALDEARKELEKKFQERGSDYIRNTIRVLAQDV